MDCMDYIVKKINQDNGLGGQLGEPCYHLPQIGISKFPYICIRGVFYIFFTLHTRLDDLVPGYETFQGLSIQGMKHFPLWTLGVRNI